MMIKSGMDSRKLLKGFKVCMVAPYLPRRGGVTIQAHLTVDGLVRDGAEVFRVDIIVHSLNSAFCLPLRMLAQPIVTAVKFIKYAGKCDVVHIQACSWWGFLPVLVCAPINKLFFKKRLVMTFHGARGHVFLKNYHWFVKPIVGMVDDTVVVSPELQQAFAKYGIETRVVGIVINLDAFRYRERSVIKPNIVWARQLDEMYDPLATLRVLENVQKEYPEATLTLIGEGPMREEMDQYISSHGLKGVKFTGLLPNTEMPIEFDKADIFLNTSKNDAKPAALLEASASGLPIVTTNAGGIPDMIDNGRDGIIVGVGDVDAMSREILSLIKDPQRAHSISVAARANAEKYGWDRYKNELISLYGLN